MSRQLELVKELGFAIKVNEELDELNIDVLCSVSIGNSGRAYRVLKKRGRDESKFPEDRDTFEEVISMAKKMVETKLVKIAKVCVDIIGETVWVDKETPITVGSIISKTEIVSNDGRHYLINTLWIET